MTAFFLLSVVQINPPLVSIVLFYWRPLWVHQYMLVILWINLTPPYNASISWSRYDSPLLATGGTNQYPPGLSRSFLLWIICVYQYMLSVLCKTLIPLKGASSCWSRYDNLFPATGGVNQSTSGPSRSFLFWLLWAYQCIYYVILKILRLLDGTRSCWGRYDIASGGTNQSTSGLSRSFSLRLLCVHQCMIIVHLKTLILP
jgi:hypothetical protein